MQLLRKMIEIGKSIKLKCLYDTHNHIEQKIAAPPCSKVLGHKFKVLKVNPINAIITTKSSESNLDL